MVSDICREERTARIYESSDIPVPEGVMSLNCQSINNKIWEEKQYENREY